MWSPITKVQLASSPPSGAVTMQSGSMTLYVIRYAYNDGVYVGKAWADFGIWIPYQGQEVMAEYVKISLDIEIARTPEQGVVFDSVFHISVIPYFTRIKLSETHHQNQKSQYSRFNTWCFI